MPQFSKALKKGNELITNLLKEHLDGIEEGYNNTEDDKGFNVNLKLKFNTKDGGDIKVQSDISYNKDVVSDSAEETISDQLELTNQE